MRFIRFALAVMFLLYFVSAAAASDASWRPIQERRDFKIEDSAAVLESAYEELQNVYGLELDVAALQKASSYIHALSGKEFQSDVIVVMIQDLSVGEPNCYYEVIFGLPDMEDLSIGGVWFDGSSEDYLRELPGRLYDQGSDEPANSPSE